MAGDPDEGPLNPPKSCKLAIGLEAFCQKAQSTRMRATHRLDCSLTINEHPKFTRRRMNFNQVIHLTSPTKSVENHS